MSFMDGFDVIVHLFVNGGVMQCQQFCDFGIV